MSGEVLTPTENELETSPIKPRLKSKSSHLSSPPSRNKSNPKGASNNDANDDNYSQSISVIIPDAKSKIEPESPKSSNVGHEVKKNQFAIFEHSKMLAETLPKRNCEKRKREPTFSNPSEMDQEQRERLYGTKRSPTVPIKSHKYSHPS